MYRQEHNLLRAASDGFPFIFNSNLNIIQSESAVGCLRRISFHFQLEYNLKSIRICSGLPPTDFFFLNWLGSSRRASTKGLRMLHDLTSFAAVPGAEQESFQPLLEAASDEFRQRFAAPTILVDFHYNFDGK